MSVTFHRIVLVTALGAAAMTVGACTQLRGHQGYIVDVDLVNSIEPGVDNRQSVLATLGKPSLSGQFDQADWYYIARDTRNYSFKAPHASAQITLHVHFDPAGNVASITRTGMEQVVKVDPYGKVTPTLGRKRGLLQDLFGNIGTVGAGGGAPAADQGGGRDTP